MMALAAPIVMFMLLTTMNRKHFLPLLLLFFVGSWLLTGCKPEVISITVDEAKLVGIWYTMDNTQEYWRFDSEHKGETWDESEDVQEGEGTKFNWEVKDNQLRMDFYGEMGQHVYYDYTITVQNDSTFTWRDLYGQTRTFMKK